MDKPHKFLKDWFAKHDAKEQARLAQIRKLVGVDAPKQDIKLPHTRVIVPKFIKAQGGHEFFNHAVQRWVRLVPKDGQVILKPQSVTGTSIFANGKVFAKALTKRGFAQLGRGAYGVVLQHPKSNKVIKVVHRPQSDGWPAYVKWVRDSGYAGSFGPKVYAYKYIAKGGFAIASMEKLDTTVGDSGDNSDLWAKYQMFSATSRSDNPMIHTLADLAEPGISQFAKDFTKMFSYANDLHEGNVMSRAGQLVVTDPLSYWVDNGKVGKTSWKALAA